MSRDSAESLVGHWWLPGRPDRPLAGTLTLSDDEHSRLDLVGSFKELADFTSSGRYPIVLGFTTRGQLITMCWAQETTSTLSAPGMLTQVLASRFVLVGSHVENEADLLFDRARMKFTWLPEWYGNHALTESIETNEEHHLQSATLRFDMPKTLVTDVSSAEISVGLSFESRGDFSRERGFRQEPAFLIEVTNPVSADELIKGFLQPLRNLLTFATDLPNAITSLEVRPRGATEPSSDATVHYPSKGNLIAAPNRAPIPHDMLLPYMRLENEFESLLRRWFDIYAKLENVFDLYFSTRYITTAPQLTFLNLVHAVEVYHRRRFSGEVAPKAKHRARLREILAVAPDEHKQWLKGVLAYSNERRLSERLAELLALVPEILDPLMPEGAAAFTKSVVDTRNYYTHWSPHLRPRAAHGEELFLLGQRLGMLMQALILRELKFDSARRTDLFRWFQPYAFLVHQFATRK